MLKKINCIVYASDFGPNMRKGFKMAVGLAQTNQARLIFLHVIEPPGRTAEMILNSYVSDDQLDVMRSKSVAKICEVINGRIDKFAAEELSSDYGLSQGRPECRIEEGKPVDRIMAVAKDVNADLIVMGSRTHSAFSQIVLGSTAHQVLFRSERPVLIVPMTDIESDGGDG